MSGRRILLVEWDAAAASARAETLVALGYEVMCESKDGGKAYKLARGGGFDFLVFDLAFRPQHSLRTAASLKKLAGPVFVFLGGSAEVKAKAMAAVPEAVFVAGDSLPEVLASVG